MSRIVTPAKIPPPAEAESDFLRWRRVHWLTPLANTWILLVAIMWVILQNLFNPQTFHGIVSGGAKIVKNSHILALAVILALLVIFGYMYLAWRRTSWAVDQRAVHFRKGIIFRSHRRVPLERIQSLDVIQPLAARILGMGKLHVESAGGSDSHLDIAFLKLGELNRAHTEIRQIISGRKSPPDDSGSAADFSGGDTTRAESSLLDNLGEEAAAGFSGYSLYRVSAAQLLKSVALREGPWLVGLGVLTLVIAVAMLVYGGFSIEVLLGAGIGVLVSLGSLILAVVGAAWARLSRDFNFHAQVTTDGIRLSSGLLETKSETIPPGRIHSVELIQPLLWRWPDWWQVKMTIAGKVGTEDNKQSLGSVLLPVGSREQTLRSLWLVVRDLGVENPDAVVHSALYGTRDLQSPQGISNYPTELTHRDGFVGIPQIARWLDPLVYNRRAFRVTRTVLIYRDGWLRRKTLVTPYERIQSVTLRQGPLQRKLGVAGVRLDLVPGPVSVQVHHASVLTAQRLLADLRRVIQLSKTFEAAEDWALRMWHTNPPAQVVQQEGPGVETTG